MNKHTLAIFDIDGTLTDSVVQHQAAFMQALADCGFAGFDTNFGGYEHHTDHFIFNKIFETQNGHAAQESDLLHFEACLSVAFEQLTADKPVREITGARDYLQALREEQGVDIVFATGSLLRPARMKLEQAGIPIAEALLLSANSYYSRDELVAAAISSARQFYGKNRYDQIVSFGDGRWDYETARNLDIGFIGIGNEQLLSLKPQHFCRDYRDETLLTAIRVQRDWTPDFNFAITAIGPVSDAFAANGITDFKQAAQFIKQLPYKRNKDKSDLPGVLRDGFGTCGTKHALLRQLAAENNIQEVQLVLCIYKMHAANTPKVAGVLEAHGLDYMPEAHNYLLVAGEVLDCTNSRSGKRDFWEDVMSTSIIEPGQIRDYKVHFHKAVLAQWLQEHEAITYTPEVLFSIREQCIAALSGA